MILEVESLQTADPFLRCDLDVRAMEISRDTNFIRLKTAIQYFRRRSSK